MSIDASIPGDVKNTIGNSTFSQDLFGTGGGISLGGVYNIPVVANLYVEPGVDLYYHTNSINIGNFDEDSSNKDFAHRSLRKFGMRVPVQVGYHFDFNPQTSFSVYTGPVLNVGFSNDYYLTTKEKNNIQSHFSGSMYNDGMNRVDLSWRIGVGVNFMKNYYIGLSGDIGMLNMAKNNIKDMTTKMHENGFQLTLGYNFK